MPVGRRWLVAVGLLATHGMGCAMAQCVKTVRWSDDAPYAFKIPSGEISGFNSELIRAVLKGLNCEVKFLELPWARALHEVEQGRLDILPGALRTPEREKFAYFSRPVSRSPNVLFVSRGAAAKYRLSDLADIPSTAFRLGAQIGVAYGADYDALVKMPAFATQITQVTSRRSAWKMIEQDRLDGIIADEVTAMVELRELKLSDAIVKTRIVVSNEPAMLALSRASLTPEFVKDLDRGLDAMIRDGRYRKIREQHIPCSASIAKLACR